MKKTLLYALCAFFPLMGFSQSQILLAENFENGSIPSSWTINQTNTNEQWQVVYEETRVAVMYNDWMEEPQDEWLITPSLDFSDAGDYSLTAHIGLSYTWAVSPYDFYDVYIKVSTDDGATWTQLWSEEDLGVFTDWDMNLVHLDLSQFEGSDNVKIGFHYLGTDGASASFDNIVVRHHSSAPSCIESQEPTDNASETSFNGITLRWSAEDQASQDYFKVYLDQNENPSTLVGTTIHNEMTIHGLEAEKTYYWKVVPENIVGSSQDCQIYSFTTSADDYCEAKALVPRFEKINNVTIAEIDNTSSSTEGYENFTGITGYLEQGQTYAISVSAERSSEANQLKVWIDFDQNKAFNQNRETVLSVEGRSPWTGTITIPEDAPIGKTRMRIRLLDVDHAPSNPVNSTPCGDGGFGQVEDYTIEITENLGIADLNAFGIKAYPNPISDSYFIDSQQKIKEIQIVDMMGKTRMMKDFSLNQINLDMTKFASGMYFIKITLEDNSVHTSKVIKQ